MSVNTIPNGTVSGVVSSALNGDRNSAVLNQSGPNGDPNRKVASIPNEPSSDVQQRIVAVVGEGNIAFAAASSQANHAGPSEQHQCISFADSTSPFGNDFPCTFGFEGKQYQNATACFLAQQYTDQPKIMDLFTTLDSEEASVLAELIPMTKERKSTWENPKAERINQDDVLMNVLKAKFEQNPDLKKQLLQTGAAYLVCQGHGFYLCDNFNGTGENVLGTTLMHLRGEFGGTGQVELPDAYFSTIEGLQARCHLIANALYPDVMGNLFNICFSQGDLISLTAVACVNKHWNQISTHFWARVDLKQLCQELTILDAKTQGVTCEDEPKISTPLLLKWVGEISPHVEGNAGVTQLTMTKGTTLNQLIEIAKGEGMQVVSGWNLLIPKLGDVRVEQTYGILISNSVFTNSRNTDFNSQNKLVKGHGCVMPTVQEYVALCVYTYKVFKKCLYGKSPWTNARSSTWIDKMPLIAGGSTPKCLCMGGSSGSQKECGAGGQKKF